MSYPSYLEHLEDRVLALEANADALRARLAEAEARCRAMRLRSARPPRDVAPAPEVAPIPICARCAAPVEPLVRLGRATLDTGRRVLGDGHRSVSLTPLERDLLKVLAGTPGRAVSYPDLLARLWPIRSPATGRHAANMVLHRLRPKLVGLLRIEVIRDHGVALIVESEVASDVA